MTKTSDAWIQELVSDVQHNCHISDAHHARNYSLCIYLLKMREFYRWEQGYSFQAPLAREPLGQWLIERESLWESLETDEFKPLLVDNSTHTPFDSPDINQQLEMAGLVYSGGYVGAKPHFFLAELERVERRHDTTIYVAGRELARELTAPPAMSLDKTIYLRRESLRRMIWEKLEEWGWSDQERAIARSVAFYDFKRDFDRALDAMTDDELDTLLQHELGEVEVGIELGPLWEQMLSQVPRSRIEYQLRAIRDHLVDCRYTLPWLLEEGRESSLHFYMANLTSLRRELFPELVQAYQQWLGSGVMHSLGEVVKRGAEQWQEEANEALSVYREHDEQGAPFMTQYAARQLPG